LHARGDIVYSLAGRPHDEVQLRGGEVWLPDVSDDDTDDASAQQYSQRAASK
jgi:hypothetical protein